MICFNHGKRKAGVIMKISELLFSRLFMILEQNYTSIHILIQQNKDELTNIQI